MMIRPSDSPVFNARILVFRLPLGLVLEDLFVAFLGVQDLFGLFRGHGLPLLRLAGSWFFLPILGGLLRLLSLLLLILLRFLGVCLILLVLLLLILLL